MRDAVILRKVGHDAKVRGGDYLKGRPKPEAVAPKGGSPKTVREAQ